MKRLSDSDEISIRKKSKQSNNFSKKSFTGPKKGGIKNKINNKKLKGKNDNEPKKQNNKFVKKGKPNMDKVRSKQKEQNESKVPDEKPNWLQYKQEQKDLREKRRAKKLDDIYNIAIQAKQIGEKLRKSKLSPEIQGKLTKRLHELLQTHYPKVVFAHDLSRVIQWQIKYSNSDIHLAIVEELKPYLGEMLSSKYAKNVLKTLLKTKTKSIHHTILNACNGKVVKLLSGVLSATLFEKLYVEIASDSEKYILKQELYGDIYKKSKDPNIKSLLDVYKNSEDMKTATLSAVKANLNRILNKNLINSTLVHTVLYEYLSNCSKDERAEMIAMTRPLIKELSQSRDGAKAGNLCIWHGTNKDRKLIMKTLKEHIKDILTSEHGHIMILGLLDSVDDTVLLKKILLQEMLNNLNEIVQNEFGRRIILYIVARRDTHYFHPALVEYLKQGDGNETSKKPPEIREKELLENVIDSLLESISTDVKMWFSNGPMQIVTLAILKASHGDKLKLALNAVTEFIINPDSKLQKGANALSVIEDPGLHMVLKKLILMDKNRVEKNEITFGKVLFEHLTIEVIQYLTNSNRGCFLLSTFIENEPVELVEELKLKLRTIENLKLKNSKGATILLQKLD